jgi:hypothetical protein
LFEAEPLRRTQGEYSTWSEVGTDLSRELAKQQLAQDRYDAQADEAATARQIGLRNADLKEWQAARAAVVGHYGAKRIAERGALDLAEEQAKAFFYTHNIVPTENHVLQRNLHRTEQDSSNPYTGYRQAADDIVTFAMPTTGDCATLETGFTNLVPENSNRTRVGWLVDPRTNLVSEVYEDLPPPAQGDWRTPEELRDSDNENRHLVRLQGGYDANNPVLPRREWEAENPLPEPTNGDAAWALSRREREYNVIAADIANNKGHMFEQSEIDKFADGFVGYQNERPYADMIPAVQATLRGYPGSGWGVTQREAEHEDFTAYAPGSIGAAAILGTVSAVTEGERGARVDRGTVGQPVGLYEPAYPTAPPDQSLKPQRPPMPPPRAVEAQYTVGTPLAQPVPVRGVDRAQPVPVGRPTGLHGGVAPTDREAVGELPKCADARVGSAPRGAAAPTPAHAAQATPVAPRTAYLPHGHDLPRATTAKVVAGPAPGLNDVTRTLGGFQATTRTGTSAHVFPAGVVDGSRPDPTRSDTSVGGPARGVHAQQWGGTLQGWSESPGVGDTVVDREAWAARSGNHVRSEPVFAAAGALPGQTSLPRGQDARSGNYVRSEQVFAAAGALPGQTSLPRGQDARAGNYVRSEQVFAAAGALPGQTSLPRGQDARAGRSSAVSSVHLAPTLPGHHQTPLANDAGIGAVGRPVPLVEAAVTATSSTDQQGGHNREGPARGPATGSHIAVGALVNPYAESVRSQQEVELGPSRTHAPHNPRDRSRHSARMTPSRETRSDRPPSRRADRPDRHIDKTVV